MKKKIFLITVITVALLSHYQIFAQDDYPQKKNAFGVDFGIGSSLTKNFHPYNLQASPIFAVGVRYMHFFNPYIGVDFLKVNFNCPFRVQRNQEFMSFQTMIGIRGNTPIFQKSMSGYAAARMGYGFSSMGVELYLQKNRNVHGIAFETEAGLNFSKTFFIAFSYNLMAAFVDESYKPYPGPFYIAYTTTVYLNTYALRFGFNF
jgi:hypothetical protein